MGQIPLDFFMLSDSPRDRKLEWTNSGIDGSNKYLLKVWRYFNRLTLTSISFHENYQYVNKKKCVFNRKNSFLYR